TTTTVFASDRKFFIFSCSFWDIFQSSISLVLPTTTRCSSIEPVVPFPSTALNPFTSNNSSCCSVALSTIAVANGCSEFFSKLAAICNISSLLPIISVTLGLPSVIVPVLSKTTVSILSVASSTSPSVISILIFAISQVSLIRFVGVVITKVHEYDIIYSVI